MTAVLWALLALLLVLWFIGYVLVHVAGSVIHLLLVVALILLIWNLLVTPRAI